MPTSAAQVVPSCPSLSFTYTVTLPVKCSPLAVRHARPAPCSDNPTRSQFRTRLSGLSTVVRSCGPVIGARRSTGVTDSKGDAMSSEARPADAGDRLDRAVFKLKALWFGLFASAVLVVVAMTAIVFSNDQPFVDLGGFSYAFLAVVPIGLAGAYIVGQMMTPANPAAVVKPGAGMANPLYDGWEGTKPDDPYYWFPSYTAVFFIRAGMLEGSAIVTAVGFMITGNWWVLGGA